MHRTRRIYERPADHPGPETVMLDGTVRVKRGESAALHTTDAQHAQLLAEGWLEGPEPAAAPLPKREDAPESELPAGRRRKNGEVINA